MGYVSVLNSSRYLRKFPGVFAGEQLLRGTFIGIYSGEVLTDQEGERRGVCVEWTHFEL